MKTRKLIRIASVLAIVVMSMSVSQVLNATESQTERGSKKAAHMSYEKAVQNSGILQAMYEQLEDDIIPHHWPYYTARINYKGNDIFIQGTYEQWVLFFRAQLRWLKHHQQ
jgi:hypothetical protein